MLGVLASYSITVKELKLLFSMLRGEGGLWVSRSHKQLELPQDAGTVFILSPAEGGD